MSFEEMNLSPEINQGISKMKYDNATTVQQEVLPAILEGHNVVVKSHTGSGKTAAFGIPISEQIFSNSAKGALILCPTRELAVQVKNELKRINQKTRLRVAVFYGGHGMSMERDDIRKGIDILVATPGRLIEHLGEGKLKAQDFKIVVLDEADRMLDMGFIHDLKFILERVKPKNTHLFSATLEGNIAGLIREYIPAFEEISIPDEIIGKNIIEKHIVVNPDEKIDTLVDIIKNANNDRVLIFVRTKRMADKLQKILQRKDVKAEAIHGDKTQKAREFALRNFKGGKISVLIGTDVAARGLQIDNVEYVVNYDPAQDMDTHKHRIGRTGRMGETGHAITFVSEEGRIIEELKRPRREFSNRNGSYSNKQGFRSRGPKKNFNRRKKNFRNNYQN